MRSLVEGLHAVPGRPRLTVRNRSSSRGSSPLWVVRNLKVPRVKSRGRGSRKSAAGPSPSPSRPWQKLQLLEVDELALFR